MEFTVDCKTVVAVTVIVWFTETKLSDRVCIRTQVGRATEQSGGRPVLAAMNYEPVTEGVFPSEYEWHQQPCSREAR